jgi:hypothetical protein
MSALDTQITKELELSLREHSRSLFKLNANYEALTKLRRQLPIKFLMKNELKVYLTQLSKKNVDLKNKTSVKVKKFQEELIKLKTDIASEVLDDKKNKIKDLYSQIEFDYYQATLELENFTKIILEATPEREAYFYEDLVLFVANCKHEALELWKYAMALYESMETDQEYYSSRFYLDVAEDYLFSKGFTKITESLRNNFLSSKEVIRDFKKFSAEASALKDASRKLVDAFESDEVNFRRFLDRKSNLGGF